jgi:DNA-binding GntR family transcriptional regulator
VSKRRPPIESWISVAQRRLIAKASQLFWAWRETKAGQNWQRNWANKPPSFMQRFHPEGVASNSPYAHGFSLPQYHHDLIAAVGRGDEETAKALMMEHYLDVV